MRKKRVFSTDFTLALVVYIFCFIIAAALGLKYLYGLLYEYESSRPEKYVSQYMSSFDSAHISEVAGEFIARLDSNLVDEQEALEEIEKLFHPEPEYSIESRGTSAMTIHVISGGIELGSAELTAYNEEGHSFPEWRISSERFDFSFLLGSRVVTAPSDSGVRANGFLLTGDYIIPGSEVVFDTFKELADIEEAPKKVSYRIENYIGELELELVDSDGSSRAYEELDENDYIDNCPELKRREIESFIEDFLKAYIRFAGNTAGNRSGNLSRLRNLVTSGSPLDELLVLSQQTLYWEQGKSNNLSGFTINHCMRLDNNKYCVDITYICDTLGTKGCYSSTNCVKMIITDFEVRFLADYMVSY